MNFLRAINHIDGKPNLTLSKETIELFTAQTITATDPGSILQDFQTLIEIIGEDGILTSGKLGHIPNKLLAEINQRLSKPIAIDLQRPSQKSYSPIHGLYLLLRTTGILLLTGQGSKQRLVLNTEVLSSWQQLNPTECYFTLLEALLIHAYGDILEATSRSRWPEGTRIAQGWNRIKTKQSFATYQAQDVISYMFEYHNLALLEMFGLVVITDGKPEPKKGWRIKSIKSTPWGEAIMVWFKQVCATTDIGFEEGIEQQSINQLQPLIRYYFPEWQQTLASPTMPFRSGRHIFKVSLQKCWRQIAMAGEANLWDFSRLILESVDFDTDHLDMFTYKSLAGHTLTAYHPYMEDESSSDEVQIGNLPLQVGGTMDYLFDFGDSWKFSILLENVEPDAPRVEIPKSKKEQSGFRYSKKTPCYIIGEILASNGKAPTQYDDYDE
jgi:hypothetical protein